MATYLTDSERGNYSGTIAPGTSSGSSGMGYSMAGSAITKAAQAYTQYSRAKHNERMTSMNWQHNKAMVTENLKVNQYISARNRLEILDASAEEALSLQTQEMQAKAEASVVHAAYGMKGGSAQQVMHSISREAEKAESRRLYSLDQALFANRVQMFGAASGASAAIGTRPVGGASSTLATMSALTSIGNDFRQIGA